MVNKVYEDKRRRKADVMHNHFTHLSLWSVILEGYFYLPELETTSAFITQVVYEELTQWTLDSLQSYSQQYVRKLIFPSWRVSLDEVKIIYVGMEKKKEKENYGSLFKVDGIWRILEMKKLSWLKFSNTFKW